MVLISICLGQHKDFKGRMIVRNWSVRGVCYRYFQLGNDNSLALSKLSLPCQSLLCKPITQSRTLVFLTISTLRKVCHMVKCHIGNKRNPMSKEGISSPPFLSFWKKRGLLRHNSIREWTGSTLPFCVHYSWHRWTSHGTYLLLFGTN